MLIIRRLFLHSLCTYKLLPVCSFLLTILVQ
uniref:Uncharacterized protein n=1 Tax=Arundo donax TaxID=35708 RepID=A0A0A9CB61_ARUDO